MNHDTFVSSRTHRATRDEHLPSLQTEEQTVRPCHMAEVWMKRLSLALLSGFAAIGVAAAPAECDLPVLSKAQRDIMAKADEGVEALRQHVWRTRGVHQYDIRDAADFAAARRKAERQCADARRNEEPAVAQAER